MLIVCGVEEGSKKCYVGFVVMVDGGEDFVFKGFEMVCIDWILFVQQFQCELYWCVFRCELYQDFICDYVWCMLVGEFDDQFVYCKCVCWLFCEYECNVLLYVCVVCIVDEFNYVQGWLLQYQCGGWISYVMMMVGFELFEMMCLLIDYVFYLSCQFQFVVDVILLFLCDDFECVIFGQGQLFGD